MVIVLRNTMAIALRVQCDCFTRAIFLLASKDVSRSGNFVWTDARLLFYSPC